jgi:hypothetical protein
MKYMKRCHWPVEARNDRGHDTLVVLKAEDVSGQISEAAGSFFSRVCGKIAADTGSPASE